MKRRKTPKRTTGTPPDSAPRERIPELPAWKAFVVQFSREANARAGTFSGRVEHLSSGRRARFGSAEELLTRLDELLGEIDTRSS